MTDLTIFAAPLQGFTESAWRNAHEKIFGNIDVYYIPFIRVEKGTIRNKDLREVSHQANKVRRAIPQIIASTPPEVQTLIPYLSEQGYKEIDLNMGCPFPLIANRQKGSGILPHPEIVANLLQEIAHYPEIKFTVKMRLGWQSEEEWKQILPLLNHSCVQQITLHPRIGKQQYKGSTNLEMFKSFYELCELPLVYNGDLNTIEDIEKIKTLFPNIKGIMLGRGLLANPALAETLRTGKVYTYTELTRKIYDMHQLIEKELRQTIEGGDNQLLQKLKTMWEYLLPDMEKKSKKAILKAREITEYQKKINEALLLSQ